MSQNIIVEGEEEVPLPLKISFDREKSVVEMKTVIGRGFYLHGLKHLLTSNLKVSERLRWQVVHAADGISFPTSDDPVICLNCNNEHSSLKNLNCPAINYPFRALHG